MKRLNSILIISSALILNIPVLAQDSYELSEELQQKIQKLEKQKETTENQIKKAKKLDDKDTLSVYENFKLLLEKQHECVKFQEELEIQNCMFKATEKLAQEGNYIAQDSIGVSYEHDLNNPEMALRWYKKTLANPKAPENYKKELKENINKLEETLSKKERAKENEMPYSEGMTQEIKFVNDFAIEVENNVKKFELLSDSDSTVFWKTTQEYLAGMQACFTNNEEYQIIMCFNDDLLKLARAGNFVAQQQLGATYYEDYNNPKMALKWLNTSLNKAKTTKNFKYKILEDIEKVEGQKKPDDAGKPSPGKVSG
jgi:hypothetical protein